MITIRNIRDAVTSETLHHSTLTALAGRLERSLRASGWTCTVSRIGVTLHASVTRREGKALNARMRESFVASVRISLERERISCSICRGGNVLYRVAPVSVAV